MAEAKPGDKICDRCDSMKATAQSIDRYEVGGVKQLKLAVDLCGKCGKIVDNAIKRAVRPK